MQNEIHSPFLSCTVKIQTPLQGFNHKPLKSEAIHETGLSGNVVASFFSLNTHTHTHIYIYIYIHIHMYKYKYIYI